MIASLRVFVLSACAVLLACQATAKPMKVFILAGQSNATGMVHTNTLAHIQMFPETAEAFADLFDADGNPVILDEVYVSQWRDKDSGKLAPRYGGGTRGNMLGPDYAFGIYMHKALQEPFLIIKTSQGGRSLNYCFRSPSAGEWTPPPGHPDLAEEVEEETLPIPETLDLPADYVDSEDLIPEVASRGTGSYMGLSGMRGVQLDEVNGVHPIGLAFRAGREERVPGQVFQSGDLIIGLNGAGLGEDAIEQWRTAYWSARSIDGDWMLNVTRWRKGVIETFDFDIAETLDGGREALPQHIEAMKKAAIEREAQRGGYYRMMVSHVKDVLGDIKSVHPAYDEEAGYEIAGFVWFQAWNDMIDAGVYPNRDKPRGYEQYTWLLENLIRDVRNDLDAPDMPFVIGVMGVGGIHTDPDSFRTHFQHAMAAPASNPEFEGTVAAVQTGEYWDHELATLAAKSDRTPEEEALLQIAVSDGGFHYMGSAKIMCGIGKGFAEAMLELEGKTE